MNVASGVLSELMSAKMDISKEHFEMHVRTYITSMVQTSKFRMSMVK